MSNLIRIENGKLVVSSREVSEVKKININGYSLDYIELYELISKMSYEVSKYGLGNLLELIKIAKLITPKEKNIPFLENSVREIVLRNFENSLPTEFDIHNVVKENIHKVIGSCKIIKKQNHGKHQPDIWVNILGEEIPIEVKLKTFDGKALKQLRRYMEFYRTDKGICVARTLSVRLPENIRFISIKELEER